MSIQCRRCGAKLASLRATRRERTRALYDEGLISYEVALEWWLADGRLSDEPFGHVCKPSEEPS